MIMMMRGDGKGMVRERRIQRKCDGVREVSPSSAVHINKYCNNDLSKLYNGN